jgi:hypothetical protein
MVPKRIVCNPLDVPTANIGSEELFGRAAEHQNVVSGNLVDANEMTVSRIR